MDIAPPLLSPSYSTPHMKNTCKGNSPSLQAAEIEQAADFLAIDDLLDFSNDDIGGPIEPCTSNATSSVSLSSGLQIEPSVLPPFDNKQQLSQPNQSCGFDSASLCVPCDDLAELEWLSNFVEESFSSGNAPACLGWGSHTSLGDAKNAHSEESFHTTSPVSVLESNAFPREKLCPAFSSSPDMSPVPGRARSKRCRTGVCFWNSRILSPEASESLLESSSITYTPIQATSSESNMYNTYYDYEEDDGDDEEDRVYRRIHHKMKNSPLKAKNSPFKVKSSPKLFNPKLKNFKVDDAAQTRKCLHCGTQKTPQWRAGPMGPKTLCNACGVRYKSGRLCEEYRPAASPTFIESVHSNSHRKVLEMRRQRFEVSGVESQKPKENSYRLRIGNGSGCAHKASDDNSDCENAVYLGEE